MWLNHLFKYNCANFYKRNIRKIVPSNAEVKIKKVVTERK